MSTLQNSSPRPAPHTDMRSARPARAPRRGFLTAGIAAAALFVSGCAAFQDSDLFGEAVRDDATPRASVARSTGATSGLNTDVAVSVESFRALSVTEGKPTGTPVGAKVAQLRKELRALQEAMVDAVERVNAVRAKTTANAEAYHITRAKIETRLQRGTTPGNPELIAQWNQAQAELDRISEDINTMASLSNEVAGHAATANYLLEAIQATFALPGGVEEDHRQLRILQDETRQTTVLIERLLTELRDDMARQTTYVANERARLTALANAIKTGEMFGGGLSVSNIAPAAATAPQPAGAAGTANAPALVTIRFDRPDVQYQQALYTALSRALEVRPDARFDVVAVSPSAGSPDQVQLAQSRSRRNAEKVVQAMIDMGLPANRIRLSATTRPDVSVAEVRIYVR